MKPAPDAPARRTPWEHILLASLVAFALALRLYRIGWGLPGIYEEAMPLSRAWLLWGWGPERPFDLNPHFFTYPSLTVYLQFLGQGFLYLVLVATGRIHSPIDFRILYEIDKTPFFLVGRSIGAMIGAATVVPAYFLARRAGGRAAAIPAALLVAVSPLLIARAQLVEVDVPLTFFVTLSCLFAVRMSESTTRFNVIAAGLAAGLAASSKYPGLIALLPPLAAILFAVAARASATVGPSAGAPAESRRSRRMASRQRPKAVRPQPGAPRPASSGAHIPVRLQLAWLFGAFVIAFIATSPYVFLDAGSAMRELSMAGEHMQAGHFGDAAGPALVSYARDWVTNVMGWPLGLASLAGLVYFALWRRSRWAVVSAAFFVPFVAIVGSWSRVADYYLLPLVPLGTVFASSLVAGGAARAMPTRRVAWGTVLVAAATLVFAAPLLASYVTHLKSLTVDSRATARDWIEANVPSGSLIATEVQGPELRTARSMLGWDEDLQRALRSAGYQPRVYGLEYLAMTAMHPEDSARFYDLRLYEPADYIVITGAVRDRYLADPVRFRPQIAFYDTLKSTWIKAREIPSTGTGCDVVLYRNPAHDRPFASRPPDSLPRLQLDPSGPLTGEEQALYWNMGANYEWFGFLDLAEAAYRQGVRFPSNHPERYRVMAWRLAKCLVRQNRVAEALAFLDSAARGAPSAGEATALREIRRTLVAPVPSRGAANP